MIASAYAASADGHAPASGLPQFDSTVFASQMFWTVVSFLILMYLMNRFIIPAIQDILDGRGNKIAEDLEQAKKSRKEAQRLLDSYREQVASAREMAGAAVEESRQAANRHREQALEDLDEELAKKKKAALQEIDGAQRNAIAAVRNAAVELAMLATQKLISKAVTQSDADAMVLEVLEQIDQSRSSLRH